MTANAAREFRRSRIAARFGNGPAERIKIVPSLADSRSGTIRWSKRAFDPQLSGAVILLFEWLIRRRTAVLTC